ncbi:hypothetical protein M5689_024667 [Euphorbia peplus]|nr:hypothetical protein M5689_024667 [Euphorbia peplus]
MEIAPKKQAPASCPNLAVRATAKLAVRATANLVVKSPDNSNNNKLSHRELSKMVRVEVGVVVVAGEIQTEGAVDEGGEKAKRDRCFGKLK